MNHLPKRLSFRDAFVFPVASPEGRRDILIGGLLVIFLLFIGWILNLGNRLNVVRRIYTNDTPFFRGFAPWWLTFQRGLVSFAAISLYLAPAIFSGAIAVLLKFRSHESLHWLFAVLSAVLFVIGVFTLPGCMTVYACEGDPKVLRHPLQAFQRAWRHRKTYAKAWRISLAAVSLSILGLLGLGVGFVFTSVWAWEVVGYVFTIAMYAPSHELA